MACQGPWSLTGVPLDQLPGPCRLPVPASFHKTSASRCVGTDSGKGRFRLINSTEEKASCGPQGTAHYHLSSGHKWSGG